jgi:hypothetical protein
MARIPQKSCQREKPQGDNIDVGGAGARTRPAEDYVLAMLQQTFRNGRLFEQKIADRV